MPFSVDEFFAVFVRYNEAIWPMQIIAYLAGVLVVILLFRNSRLSTVFIMLVLAAMWAMNGIGYHWLFFAEVNPIARVFAAVFILQAVLLALSPWLFSRLSFGLKRDVRSAIGLTLILFAAVLYPLWGAVAGHAYPSAPVFGVAPCPTTIFTVGVLLIGSWRSVRWMLIIPAIWSAIGGSAAVLLQVPQDFGLIATLLIIGLFAVGHWQRLTFAQHEVNP